MPSKRTKSSTINDESDSDEDYNPNAPKKQRLPQEAKNVAMECIRKTESSTKDRKIIEARKSKQAEVVKEAKACEVQDLTGSHPEDAVENLKIVEVQDLTMTDTEEPAPLPKGNTNKNLMVVPRPDPMPSTGKFPRFAKKAKVYIELVAGHETYTYRLDMERLKAVSGWFASALNERPKEPDRKIGAKWTSDFGLTHVFDLEYIPHRGLWFLRKTVSQTRIQ
jgi:hypothetical protein